MWPTSMQRRGPMFSVQPQPMQAYAAPPQARGPMFSVQPQPMQAYAAPPQARRPMANMQGFVVQSPPIRQAQYGIPPPFPLAPPSKPDLFQSQVGPVFNPPRNQQLDYGQLPLPTRSTEIAYTPGLQQYVHSSTACSSDFHNLAERLNVYFSAIHPRMDDRLASQHVEEGLKLIENCLSERYRDSHRDGREWDKNHKYVYDLIKKLKEFVEYYYNTAGKYPITISFREGGDPTSKTFEVRSAVAVPIHEGSRLTSKNYFITDEKWMAMAGGNRRKKHTYRKRKHVRKTRTKKISRYGKQ